MDQVKKCIHRWNGKVNTRQVNNFDFPGSNYLELQDYVICRKCAKVKIIREYEKQIAV